MVMDDSIQLECILFAPKFAANITLWHWPSNYAVVPCYVLQTISLAQQHSATLCITAHSGPANGINRWWRWEADTQDMFKNVWRRCLLHCLVLVLSLLKHYQTSVACLLKVRRWEGTNLQKLKNVGGCMQSLCRCALCRAAVIWYI